MKIFKAKGLSFLLVLLLVFLCIVPSTAYSPSFYYMYNMNGSVGIAGTNTVLFYLDQYDDITNEKTGVVIKAYCADHETFMARGVKYRISREASDQLRAILKNTSPKVLRADLTSNINNSWVGESFGKIDETLSSPKVITGSQYAIWHFTNSFDDSISDSDVNKLYQYLISLPEESGTGYANVDITVKSTQFDKDNNLIVNFTYTNPFDTIMLSKSFDGVVINYEAGTGTIFIPSSSLEPTISFSIIVSANRIVNDAYILSIDGEVNSQELVAFTDKNIVVSAEASIQIDPPVEISSETAWAFGGDSAIRFNDSKIGLKNWGWTNGPLTEGTYKFDLYAGAGQNDLSKGTLVGSLNVKYINGKVTVSYDLLPGYTMGEAQLYIGNGYLPIKGKGYTNSPGQFSYKNDFNTAVSSYQFGEYSFTGDIYIAAHAVVSSK